MCVRMGDIKTLLTAINGARPAYEKAKAYSDGTVTEVWASSALAARMRKSAGQYPINIARRPIDAVLDRLEIKEVSVADEPALTDELVARVWEDNELDLELPDALDLAETYGDSYLISWPRPDSDGHQVDLFVNDPVGMRVIYDPENPRRKMFAGRTWITSEGYRRVTLWYAGPRVERYISKLKTVDADASFEDANFQPFLADEGDEMSWFEDLELGLDLPVHHLRTARPYGKPEHFQAYGTQNMLTKEVATMMDAADGYGLPFRYALTKAGTTGATATLDDGDWGPDDGDTPRAPTATKVEPGTIAKFPDTDAVGQLQPADVTNFLAPISMTLRLSATVTNTPLSYFDASAASASGESKKEHEKPAVKKADRRLASYDATIKDALAYCMALLDHQDIKIMITWAPTESVDDAAEVELATKRGEAGVPFLTRMTQLGYPKEEVERWITDATTDDEVLEHRAKLLADVADSAVKLGTAATLGVLDSAAAQQMIANFLTTPAPAGD